MNDLDAFKKVWGLELDKKNKGFSNLIKKIEREKKFSMSSRLQKKALKIFVEYINSKKIPGDFVECGTYKGANIVLLRYLTKKKIHVFDTFSGMTEYNKSEYNLFEKKYAKDLLVGDKHMNRYWTYATFKMFKQYLLKFNSFSNLNIIKGDVRKTLLKKNNIKKISLLICDTDFYDSSLVILKKLYQKVSTGGVIIFDDYSMWTGQKKAVDKFFKHKKNLIFPIDGSASFAIKL